MKEANLGKYFFREVIMKNEKISDLPSWSIAINLEGLSDEEKKDVVNSLVYFFEPEILSSNWLERVFLKIENQSFAVCSLNTKSLALAEKKHQPSAFKDWINGFLLLKKCNFILILDYNDIKLLKKLEEGKISIVSFLSKFGDLDSKIYSKEKKYMANE